MQRTVFRAIQESNGVLVVAMFLLCATPLTARKLTSEAKNDTGGFLTDELPLQMLTTTPLALARGSQSSVYMSGAQAITVAYSRAVIALGHDFDNFGSPDQVPFTLEPNVPGRFRWVTTSIARWDPEGSWPLDSEIKLTWNQNLKTQDGGVLQFDGPRDVMLKTQGLDMYNSGVESKKASNLTDGSWDPYTGLDSAKSPEVPPDGVMMVVFTHKVSLTSLQKNLKIEETSLKKEAKGLKLQVAACENEEKEVTSKPCLRCALPSAPKISKEESYCAAVSIQGDLKVATGYALVLPNGTVYSSNAGPLKTTLRYSFGGLREFSIPFQKPVGSIDSNNLRLWLPHGLKKSSESDIQALKSQVTIYELDSTAKSSIDEVDFDLELESKTILLISASFIPEKKYRLKVEGSKNILSGFGLPLKGAALKFQTSRVSRFFDVFSNSRYSIFELGQDWGHTIVAAYKGKGGKKCKRIRKDTVNIYPIVKPGHIKGISKVLDDFYLSKNLTRLLGEPAGQLSRGKATFADIEEYDISGMMNATGMVAYDYCGIYSTPEFGVISESDMQAIVIGSPRGFGIVWVTSMKTGEPVVGAEVSLLAINSKRARVDSVSTTDAEGKAVFTDMDGYKHDIVHVQHNNRSILVRSVDTGFEETSEATTAEMVLDRALVKQGDTLHIKGYTRGFNLTYDAAIEVIPAFGFQRSEVKLPVTIDPKFGTFEVDLPIPENAINMEYEVFLVADENDGYFPTERFTVGNPRPPTVGLTLETPSWAKPDSKVLVNLTAESFIGAAVGGAMMDLKWRVEPSSLSRQEELQGEVEVVMDSFGRNTTEIDLGVFEDPSSAPSELKIEVSWVGPTRELIKETSTIRLRKSNLELDFDRTVNTDFPGQEFGVKLIMNDLDETPVNREVMVVNLKELDVPEDKEDFQTLVLEPINGTVIDACEIQPGSKSYDCRFSLPGIGQYALETCTEASPEAKEIVCRRELLGKTQEQWEERMMTSHLPMSIIRLSNEPLRIGDKVEYGIENPYHNVKAIVMWGTAARAENKVFDLEDASLARFTIQLGEECQNGCTLTAGVVIPRQVEGLALNENNVPSGKLIDLAMPQAREFEEAIKVRQGEAVEVDLVFPELVQDEDTDLVMAPGETTSVQINVTGQPSNGEVEVTVMAVDKSILELVPYALKDLSEALELVNEDYYGFSDSASQLVSPEAITALLNDFYRRREISPWASPETDLGLGYNRADKSNQTLIDEIAVDATYMPSPPGPIRVVPGQSPFDSVVIATGSASVLGRGSADSGGPVRPSVNTELSAAKSQSIATDTTTAESDSIVVNLATVRQLSDFVVSALFKTVVVDDGLAVLNFTTPENLGTFNFRAYVATADGQYGSVEKEVIVRRLVSLTPTAPRFARVGDEFEAGAVVTVSGSNPENSDVAVKIELLEDGSLELQDVDAVKVINVGEDGNAEVRFNFKASRMGEAKFKISAGTESGAGDALIINFPVEGLQDPVTVATSVTLSANSSGEWEELIRIPDAVPGSGSVSLQAGVGQLPAILSLSSQLYEENPRHECPIAADYALAVASIPLVTETYKVLDIDSAGASQAIFNTLGGMVSNFSASAKSLRKTTKPGIGLDCFLSCQRFPRTFPGSPLFVTNGRGLFLMNMLDDELRSNQREGLVKGIRTLLKLRKKWAVAMEKALLRRAKKEVSVANLAFARAALGAEWTPSKEVSPEVLNNLSMERLSKKFDRMTVESQAYYIVALLSTDDGVNHPDVEKAIASWTNRFRVVGRSAYIARAKGSATPASNIANSLALMVMVKAQVDSPFVGKLANYVGSPPVSPYGFQVFSAYEKAVAMIALRDYDVSRGSVQPDTTVNIRSGNTTLMNAQFVSATSPVSSSTTPLASLDSGSQPVEVLVNGTGEVAVAASVTYIPARLLTSPTFRGLLVQRSISIPDSQSANSLKTVPVKSIVEVVIQVTTPDRLGPATVRALMPAGLEPVDPNIAGEKESCPIPLSSMFFSVFRSFQCPDQETEPSVVSFRFNSMEAGTQTLRFRAVAATAGRFALPPVKALVDDFPEVMGLSSAGELVVCTGEGCVPEADTPVAIPKTCAANCNDNGFCDAETGTCVCFDGFKGDSCGDLLSE